MSHLRFNCPDVENPQQQKPPTENYAKNYTQASPYHYFANPQSQSHAYQSSNPPSTSTSLPFRGQGAYSPPAPAVITGADFVPQTTSPGTVQHHAQQHRIHVIEPIVVKNNQANSAQNSQEIHQLFEHPNFKVSP